MTPLLIALLSLPIAAVLPPTASPELRALIAQAKQVRLMNGGISDADDALAKQLQAYGARAIPLLLPLLDSGAHEFIGYVLRDIPGLTDKDLAPLIAALRHGNGWIAPALAHVGTPRAIEGLIADLERHPETENQTTYALTLTGEAGATLLAQRFGSKQPLSPALALAIATVFSRTDDVGPQAIDALAKVASNPKAPRASRLAAVRALGFTHAAGHRAAATLQAVAAKDTSLTEAAEQALIAMGAKEAVPILAAKLETHPQHSTLVALAMMGSSARAAGPDVARLLEGSDWDLRLDAALTLGFIGYNKADPKLVALLGDTDDWRVVRAAAQSLGRLLDPSALAALKHVAQTHWYAPVRACARAALDRIRSPSPDTAHETPSEIRQAFYSYQQVSSNASRSAPETHSDLAATRVDAVPPAALAKLSYPIRIEGSDETAGQVHEAHVKPGCGLKVPGGLLLGSSRGEWGGETVFLDDKGQTHPLLSKNTIGIFKMPFGILAVTGLAHLGFDHGMVYLITPSTDGGYSARRWKTLPGTPRTARVLKNGALRIDCNGGVLVLSPTGALTTVPPP